MPLITDLQTFYPLSTTVDDAWSGDNGTNSGGTFGVYTGVASLDFAGSGASYAYVLQSVYNDSFGTGDFTFSMWVRPDVVDCGAACANTILSREPDNYEITIYQGNILAFVGGAGNTVTTTSGAAVSIGTWQNIIVSRASGVVTIYIDNTTPAQSTAGTVSGTIDNASYALHLGIRPGGAHPMNGSVADIVVWKRAITALERADIHSAGAGNFNTLLPTPQTQYLATEIATVVHTANPYSTLNTLESTVVHDSVKHATADTLIATAVHASVIVSGTVANITGTVSSSASWDATPMGLSTGSASFQWEWQSVPAGSTLTSGSFQLPNSGSTTLLNMSGNTGLWHLEATSSTSIQQGSIGLVDTWGDGWHGNNFVNVSVNGAPVLSNITLAAGTGPEWFNFTAVDGDTVEVTYTAGSFPNECKYYISSGSDGSVAGGFTSSAPPATPYSFTALGFSTASVITTLDSSGEGNTATVYGTTQTTNTRVGDYAFNFNGSSDYIELVKPSVLGIDGSKSRTIAFWASASAWADSTIMFSMGTNSTDQDFTFIQKATNNLALTFWAGGSDLLVTPGSTTGWNHYCVIYDSENTTSYVYQNNILLGSTVRAQNTSNISNVKIGEGTAGWVAAPHFSGSISEFAIWDRALDAVDRENIFFLQSGSCASGSFSGSVGLGDEFTFMPEVSGTYEVKLNVTDGIYNSSGSVFAYITAEPPTPPSGSTPVISASVPSGSLIQEIPIGYTYNTYTMMSAQRTRTVEQVPFKLGGKGIQSLRLRPNTDFTGSS